jgi:molecular chaperone GrpE (heat shock protein)
MNQELLDQFLGLLEASSSFKLLGPEQQAAIRDSYQNATDEQLNQGIQALREDQIATEEAASEDEKREEELNEEIDHIKTVLREVKRDERKEEEAADDAASEKEVQGLLKEIDSMDEPKEEAPKKKRKKFLGIF